MVNELHFESLQKAWEGVNEFMVTQPLKVLETGGGVYGTEFVCYNNRISSNNCFIDEDFDFGYVLGYSPKKWTTLIKNYVDFNYLDLLKSEITSRRAKKAKSYNYAFRFSNKYGGGKDCLMGLIFTKQVNEEFPTVYFSVRVSEVTSRLIFDFLLVQRICEYIYGKGYPVQVKFDAPSMYVTAERFTMYAQWKGWKKIKKKMVNRDNKFQARVIKTMEEFTTVDPETITWKVHQRCAKIVQQDYEGFVGKKVPPLLPKHMPLHKLIKSLPKDVITDKEIKAYLKQIAKENQ